MILIILLATLMIFLVVWLVIVGPVAVYRIISRGTTTIIDFRRFPGRNLQASPTPFYFKTSLQEKTMPETINLEKLREIKLDKLLETSDTIAFIVIKDDFILYERYFQGHSVSSISQLFSTSKSLLSILIGTAIDDGFIVSVEQAVTAYVPELANAGFREITIENLLNMQSSMDYFENDNLFGKHVIFNYTDHLEKEILKLRLLQKPDKLFRYKSGENALLGLVLDRALGSKTITQYMQERLWTPLGMEYRGIWGVDRNDGLERTWCCLSASARDLAKFGRLYLRNGNWEGKQIVSPEWVKKSTGAGAYTVNAWPNDLRNLGLWNYKYQYWLLSEKEGDFATWGKGGQHLYGNPDKKLIIVRLGKTDGNVPWFLVFQELAQCIS